jgi:hypothetical protein
VDLSEQRMYVYQDGVLLWNWVVSTGEPGRDTRPGNSGGATVIHQTIS